RVVARSPHAPHAPGGPGAGRGRRPGVLRRPVRLPLRSCVQPADALLPVPLQPGRAAHGDQCARRQPRALRHGASARVAPDLPRRGADARHRAGDRRPDPPLHRSHRREPVCRVRRAGGRHRVRGQRAQPMKQPLAQDYQQELSDFRVTYSRAGSVTSIVLVMLGVGLDLSSYPDRWVDFLLARVAVSLITAAILVLLFFDVGRRQVRLLTMVWLLLPQAMIAWMIQQTEGVASIYFVGLHLALYAVGIILPISFMESLSFGFITLLLYLLGCALHPAGLEPAGMAVTHSL